MPRKFKLGRHRKNEQRLQLASKRAKIDNEQQGTI